MVDTGEQSINSFVSLMPASRSALAQWARNLTQGPLAVDFTFKCDSQRRKSLRPPQRKPRQYETTLASAVKLLPASSCVERLIVSSFSNNHKQIPRIYQMTPIVWALC